MQRGVSPATIIDALANVPEFHRFYEPRSDALPARGTDARRAMDERWAWRRRVRLSRFCAARTPRKAGRRQLDWARFLQQLHPVVPADGANNGAPNRSPASPNPGVPVVLPNGENVEINDQTQYLMSRRRTFLPWPQRGGRSGAAYLDMLGSDAGGGALLYSYLLMLGYYVGHGGVFDYERSGSFLFGYTRLPNLNMCQTLM